MQAGHHGGSAFLSRVAASRSVAKELGAARNVIGHEYPVEANERIHHIHAKVKETKAHDALTAQGNSKVLCKVA